jgi:hypothetical protein
MCFVCYLNSLTTTYVIYGPQRFLGLRSSLITLQIFARLLCLIAQNAAKVFNLNSGVRIWVRGSRAMNVSRGSVMGLKIV